MFCGYRSVCVCKHVRGEGHLHTTTVDTVMGVSCQSSPRWKPQEHLSHSRSGAVVERMLTAVSALHISALPQYTHTHTHTRKHTHTHTHHVNTHTHATTHTPRKHTHATTHTPRKHIHTLRHSLSHTHTTSLPFFTWLVTPYACPKFLSFCPPFGHRATGDGHYVSNGLVGGGCWQLHA